MADEGPPRAGRLGMAAPPVLAGKDGMLDGLAAAAAEAAAALRASADTGSSSSEIIRYLVMKARLQSSNSRNETLSRCNPAHGFFNRA